ncbi:hypothetical protein Bacsa_0039 [Phocaeicola salanitronis DSM 18170]|uniref:Uncharacterized protein n=1 Tax=Phocaeicola salanitronis (strain DSM 18170 / JCM 13657 / CCUG 60908 / BL78) TaxID=667015 RepID=F0R4G4_PHOSB|nr:hypothetical protein Bacsa_0039 [Phocaeicola salanitronis DSM 18170]
MAEQKDLMLCKFFTTFATAFLNGTQRHKDTESFYKNTLKNEKIKTLCLRASVFHDIIDKL